MSPQNCCPAFLYVPMSFIECGAREAKLNQLPKEGFNLQYCISINVYVMSPDFYLHNYYYKIKQYLLMACRLGSKLIELARLLCYCVDCNPLITLLQVDCILSLGQSTQLAKWAHSAGSSPPPSRLQSNAFPWWRGSTILDPSCWTWRAFGACVCCWWPSIYRMAACPLESRYWVRTLSSAGTFQVI